MKTTLDSGICSDDLRKDDEIMATRTTEGLADFALVKGAKTIHELVEHPVANEDALKQKRGLGLCGQIVPVGSTIVEGVDERAVVVIGTPVCSKCLKKRRDAQAVATDTKEGPVPTKTTSRKTSSATPRATGPKAAASRAKTPASTKPIGKAALDKAVKKAAQLRTTTPELSANLTKKQREEEKHLAKMISADVYFLGLLKPDASEATVQAKLDRIETRVKARNALRRGK